MSEEATECCSAGGESTRRRPDDELSARDAAASHARFPHLAAIRSRSASESPRSPTVAVLDDEADAAASICQCLNLQRLSAVPFLTAPALLDALQHRQIDAFVLDWTLARGTSLDLVHALRTQPTATPVPIFILSGTLSVCGKPLDRQLASAIASYGLRYRAKPVSCAKLARDLLVALGAEVEAAVGFPR